MVTETPMGFESRNPIELNKIYFFTEGIKYKVGSSEFRRFTPFIGVVIDERIVNGERLVCIKVLKRVPPNKFICERDIWTSSIAASINIGPYHPIGEIVNGEIIMES